MKRLTISLAIALSFLSIGLSGCGNSNVANTNLNTVSPTEGVQMKRQVPDYKLNGSLPDKWKLELEGQNKGALLKYGKTVGRIEVIGYYGDKVDLPNHTTLVKTEEVNTG